ncbi:MAG TPA: hypothetical protein O0X51_07810 [Methanocorpusculum sp.]|nr:hypothetical protein [Methanocorpusculum sp.]HJK72037.1 hypothetical protein [Methanocorpusculum sp.]HJK83161.1 hypothetical protein [Methanocorpusculum sp.]
MRQRVYQTIVISDINVTMAMKVVFDIRDDQRACAAFVMRPEFLLLV